MTIFIPFCFVFVLYREAHREKLALYYALSDASSIVGKLDSLITAIMCLSLLFVIMLIFGLDVAGVLISISSTLLLFAFVFGDAAKNFINCTLFIFVTRPFDYGDRCEVEGLAMLVERVDLLSTTFRLRDNRYLYIYIYIV